MDSNADALFFVGGVPDFVSTTLTLNQYVPAVVALPEITPAVVSVRPGGRSAPGASDQVWGG